MNLVFFGTSEFAVPSLKSLLASRHRVLAVVTQPDRPRGRKLDLTAPPVKLFAQGTGLSILQPPDASSPDFAAELGQMGAACFVVVAFGQVFRKPFFDIPGLFAINLHASLLPKYRGAAPVNWAIIRGETETGVTIFKVEEVVDAGEILAQQAEPIRPDDTATILAGRLSILGAELLVRTLEDLESGTFSLRPQKGEPSRAPKLSKEDGFMDWDLRAFDLFNRVRGLVPWPTAYTFLQGESVKIWEARVQSIQCAQARPGEVVAVQKEGVFVQAGQGQLVLTSVQPEGGRVMDGHSFALGRHLGPGVRFGQRQPS